jgi:plastocyanin
MRKLRLTAILGLTVAASAAAVSLAFAGDGEGATAHTSSGPRIVTVADDYFAPTTVKIRKGRRVRWVWSQLNYDPHNARLTKRHPPGVRRRDFRSATGTIGIKFIRRFIVPGKYGFICTIHPTVMKMTVVVHK